MRISELSRASGVPVPTLKYYLREGLLQPGTATAPNQARYDERHLRRLRLIRALTDVGGLSLGAVHAVLDAIADETLPLHDLLGVAHHALGPQAARGSVPPDVAHARREVDAFVDGLRWHVSPDAPARHALADALVGLRRLGRDVGTEVFAPYARLADELAAREIRAVPGGSRVETVESAVVGTVVFEAALVALRRLALEHHSAVRFTPVPPRPRHPPRTDLPHE